MLQRASRNASSCCVAAVETVSSRLDEAEAALERVQRNLKRYRAVVLQAAVEGRLVPTEAELARREGQATKPHLSSWTGFSRSAEAGSRGLSGQNANGQSASTGLGLDNGGPSAWDSDYGTSQKCRADYDGPAVLRIPNVVEGKIDLRDLKYASAPLDLRPRHTVTPGDFLFIRTNGSPDLIGRGALIHERLPGELYFASYPIRLRLVPIDPLPSCLSAAKESA